MNANSPILYVGKTVFINSIEFYVTQKAETEEDISFQVRVKNQKDSNIYSPSTLYITIPNEKITTP